MDRSIVSAVAAGRAVGSQWCSRHAAGQCTGAYVSSSPPLSSMAESSAQARSQHALLSAAQRRASCSSTQGARALRSRVQCAPVQSTFTRSWSSSSSDPFSMKSKSSCVATPSASGFGSAVSLAFFFSLDFDFAGLLRCTPRLVQARSVRWF